jgi:hypothetical protein
MKIPTTIKVGPRTYDILQPTYTGSPTTVGRTHYHAQTMIIATHGAVSGKKRTDAQRSETFWHELTHAILYDMDNPLEGDEKFVTAFAARLNDAIRSAKF